MLTCAFVAEPYLDGWLLPLIAFGTGALVRGRSLLVAYCAFRESYREAVRRLRPALKNARAKHYADERGLEALLAERVLRLQESRIGRAMRPLHRSGRVLTSTKRSASSSPPPPLCAGRFDCHHCYIGTFPLYTLPRR